jgi:gliding motility-associated-like protein
LNVIVKESPNISYTYSTQALGGEFNVSFTNTTANGDSYIWMFGDTSISGNVSYDINPSHSYSNTGQYPVSVYASNSFGCTALFTNTIFVNTNNALFIPTTFTPNGDGKNDIFRVRGDQFLLKEMAIYDQWGTLVYRTDASLPYWDGKSQGNVLQNATYVYRINLIDQDQVAKELTGSITLIK